MLKKTPMQPAKPAPLLAHRAALPAPPHVAKWNAPFPFWPALLLLPLLWLAREVAAPGLGVTAASFHATR